MKQIILVFTFLFMGSAFAAVSDDSARRVFNKLDEQCAGNDNGFIDRFDVKKFKAGKAKKELRNKQNGCKGMKMSKNKTEAVNAFLNYLDNSKDDFSQCVRDNLASRERDVIRDVVMEPSNVAVFSSQYDGGDESEACSFHHFAIYRASGQKILVVHDETD